MTTYCRNCGEGIEYFSKIPIVCPFCAKSLTNQAQTQVNTIQAKIVNKVKTQKEIKVVESNEDDDYTDDDIDENETFNRDIEAPEEDGISISVDSFKPSKLIDLATAGANSNPNSFKVDRPQEAPMSKEQVLQEFAREAGSIRKK
jgi:hypothetical protein